MNYCAKNDALFADGHYVEEWELRRFTELPSVVQDFVRGEASRGNKLQSVLERMIVLTRPPSLGVLALPEGLSFVCPLQHSGVRVYDGDEDGVILAISGDVRIYPSGLEQPSSYAPNSTDHCDGNAV
jgi:hypothetical protein